MAKKRKMPPPRGKLRTREHVLAGLAVNNVERHALLGNGATERIQNDYGLDLILFTFTTAGRLEGGNIYLQVKGTERLRWTRGGGAAFRIERTALVGWLAQPLPVILIVYDASEDRAYWLHVQGYFAALPGFSLFTAGKRVTVHLDPRQVLDAAAIRVFAGLRDHALGV